ncbi:MAG: DUF4760 domain-containing protein [Gammaproteobacteria bacterium]|nr:DUF4760 domain-containing protein [Gammaproteobacteria bacterium]
MKILTENKVIADAIKTWLGILAIIFAGAYSLLEYIEHKQTVKVERSLDYVSHLRSGNAAEAKLSLNQLLADKQQALGNILNKQYSSESELNTSYNAFILQITSTPQIQRQLEVAFSFFEEVAICVEKELCDEEVIKSFFTHEAIALFNSYYPYVCSLRQQWKNKTVYLKLERFYLNQTGDICA